MLNVKNIKVKNSLESKTDIFLELNSKYKYIEQLDRENAITKTSYEMFKQL